MKKILIILFINFVINITINSQNIANLKTDTLYVNGICQMCKKRIENFTKKTHGIVDATWDEETKILHFTYDPSKFEVKKLIKNIVSAGHDTRSMKAKNEDYDRLPECCHYRTEDHSSHNHSLEFIKSISGIVYEYDNKNHKTPLVGANVYFNSDKKSIFTDEEGKFNITMHNITDTLIVSYVGYSDDTLYVDKSEFNRYEITKSNNMTLHEVVITKERRSTEYSIYDVSNISKIGVKELRKAACCNLSESFETSPSVDVNYTDAVTNAKTIELLGLAGKYVQITRENMPYIRGLSNLFGMGNTPGYWIEGIQIIKGSGSVVNGYESLTGQINIDFQDPNGQKPLSVNLYQSANYRSEANIISDLKINDNIKTAIFLNGVYKSRQMDENNDGFIDEPTGSQINIANKWKLQLSKGFESQIGLMFNNLKLYGGQVDNPISSKISWNSEIGKNRFESFLKLGRVFSSNEIKSIGFQFSFVRDELDTKFGIRNYNCDQNSFYSNLIYQNYLFNKKTILKAGASMMSDNIDENFIGINYSKNEITPGVFTELTYKPDEKFTAVLGIRGDNSNYYGLFFTPRINFKYNITTKSVIRAMAGSGQRSPLIFIENIGVLASSREFIWKSSDSSLPYGLNMEKAWNLGLNYIYNFDIFNNQSVLSLDYYFSNFSDQVILDLENPREATFYNLKGKSYSHSIQSLLELKILKNLNFRIAYRFNDVKTQYANALLDKPLSSRNRAFFSIAYDLKKSWKFDYTFNWQGVKRIPSTIGNINEYRLNEKSPSYFVMNFQMTKSWKSGVELYLGIENILDYKQKNPIISADDPYSKYFDSSLIWGPVMGRNIYLGFRYDLKKS